MHLTFMHRHGIILYRLNFPKYWILRFVHCQTILFKGLQGNKFLFYLSLVYNKYVCLLTVYKSFISGGKWNNFVLRGNWIMPKKNDKLSDNLF